jgi:hypothetical protein
MAAAGRQSRLRPRPDPKRIILLGKLPASVLVGVYGGFSPSTEISVERERIVREIARIEDEIEKFKRLELAA